MKKSELKTAFEKNFEKISVSDELKKKTLNAINKSSAQKISYIPYLKNFAAVFVVSLLCLSIYFSTEHQKNNIITHEALENQITPSEKILRSLPPEKSTFSIKKPSPTNELNYNYGILPEEASVESAKLKASPVNNSIATDLDMKLTEEEFLTNNPNAEKSENGYIIYENGEKKLYTFKDNILENIAIIE